MTAGGAAGPPVIAALLPAAARCVEAFGDVAAPAHPDELALVARAVESRRREFVTARWCAREALARLGVAPGAILADERGAPRWPAGVVGSISHCRGYRACAVAHAAAIRTLGIDAEPNEPVSPLVRDGIAADDERADLRALAAADPRVCWERLLFCAKESFYKAHYQLNREPLAFEAVHVSIDAGRGAFTVRLRAPGASEPRRLGGRWRTHGDLLLTAVALEV